jgi:precorrin-6B methylase 2
MRRHLSALGGLVLGPALDRLAGLTARRSRPARHSRDVVETAARLIDQGWAAHALVAGAECGLVDALADGGGDISALATRTALPEPIAESMLDLLLALGLAERDGSGRYRGAPGVDKAAVAALRAGAFAAHAQWRDFAERAPRGRLDLLGWHTADPALIEAQATLSMHLAKAGLPRLLLLSELRRRLEAPDARFLDVGAGAAGVSMAFARAFPALRVVALEPAAVPLAAARRLVTEAGLDERIELRAQRIEDLQERQAFDVVFLPQIFLSETSFREGLRRIAAASCPGGALLVVSTSVEGDGVAKAVARLKNLLWGGSQRCHGEVARLVCAAGFRTIIPARRRPDLQTAVFRRLLT